MKTTKAPKRSDIGVRDAKAQLSRLLQDVREGREWTITDRGKPVARLVPISQEQTPLEDRIRRLEELGIIEPASPRRTALPPPIEVEPGLAQQMLDDDRNGGS